ncbi:MAG: sn-glycerol-1-phosphate dehydrogenase [Oscillospiraceae bacterium]|nr:sn-glycerol-1-phosphate dehydrogenase [Oscillospiraceae bacterium]
MSMEKLNAMNGAQCSCGKIHTYDTQVYVGKGVVENIPQYLQQYAPKKAFVLSDPNTYKAAGEKVCSVLKKAGMAYSAYSFTHDPIEPDEYSVGSMMMHYDPKCDVIVAVGSGVVNDLGKILSNISGKPYMIVGTAPSMDGYASATSSMTRDGLKTSLPSRAADIIVGDVDILCQAPMHMMKSGLGDMLAKYVSICEWRIANLLLDEYYCEEIADLIRSALKACVDNAEGLLKRDPAAVQAVFEGLVIGGVAMNYAGLSRPASGGEHYLSHVIDMRAVEFGTPMDLHGIQCAIGTLISAKLYEKIKTIKPNAEKAKAYVAAFSTEDWFATLRQLLGKGAEAMIAQEAREGKYDKAKHATRLEDIITNWDAILQIIEEELPSVAVLDKLMDTIEAPKTLEEIGLDSRDLPVYFKATKDIRDKYVLSRLCWDLGIIDEIVEGVK